MKRTISTGLAVWRRRGICWPVSLLTATVNNLSWRLPRGLIAEPSQGCTGKCKGCPVPDSPSELDPELFAEILKQRRARPVTIHFAGRHSDPLAANGLPELVSIARRFSSMVSVSTIGLGLRDGWEKLPVDRWILSVPAATPESWFNIRGNGRFGEFRENLKRLIQADKSMVELVLTIWKPSSEDTQAFLKLAGEEGVSSVKKVFGRFDPEGYHLGRLENLALDDPGNPYIRNGGIRLKREPSGCSLAGTIFLDAAGKFHPCPFTPEIDSLPVKTKLKKLHREFEACRFCP